MRLRIAMLAVASLAAACSVDHPTSSALHQDGASASAQADEITAGIEALGNALNAQLIAEGASVRVASAEWLTDDATEATNNVYIFADVGNKKLDADWVPGDPRRGGRTNITYRINDAGGQAGTVTPAQTSPAIDRAMATWNGVNCSVIPITKVAGYAGPFSADITHNGWVTLPPGVLGVTITFVFVAGPGGPPTDIDNNHRDDVAFRPIFYGQRPDWMIDANIDVETVVLHEAGHGLSQAHFGKLFATPSNQKFHFAPRAVMNAGYTGVQQTIGETDNAGHCANWASWPNN